MNHSANIHAALYADRLEIVSPGGLLRDITVEERGGCLWVTFYRPAVADKVNRGVNGVSNGVNAESDGSNSETSVSESVMRLILQDNRISAARIASMLGIGSRTAQRALKNLQSVGRIRRVGGTRGHWEVLT